MAGSGLALTLALLAWGSRGSGPPAEAAPPADPAPPAASRSRPSGARVVVGAPGAAAPPHAVHGAARRSAPASHSPVGRALAAYSADELSLLADFERLTGREASAELLALLDRRRAHATPEELKAAARHLFAGDPLGRAAALGWLRAHGSER